MLNFKRRNANLLYIRNQSVPRCKHSHTGYKSQSVNDV